LCLEQPGVLDLVRGVSDRASDLPAGGLGDGACVGGACIRAAVPQKDANLVDVPTRHSESLFADLATVVS